MSKVLKAIVNIFIILALLTAVAIVVPPLVGVTTTIIDTESINTNLPMGSVTYSTDINVMDIKSGDKILKETESSSYAYVIRSGDPASGKFEAVSATDSSAAPETITLRNNVSRIVITIPVIGYVVVAMHSMEGIIIIGLVVVLMIILFILSELWKKKPEEELYEDEEYMTEKELRRQQKKREKAERKKAKKQMRDLEDDEDYDDDEYEEESRRARKAARKAQKAALARPAEELDEDVLSYIKEASKKKTETEEDETAFFAGLARGTSIMPDIDEEALAKGRLNESSVENETSSEDVMDEDVAEDDYLDDDAEAGFGDAEDFAEAIYGDAEDDEAVDMSDTAADAADAKSAAGDDSDAAAADTVSRIESAAEDKADAVEEAFDAASASESVVGEIDEDITEEFVSGNIEPEMILEEVPEEELPDDSNEFIPVPRQTFDELIETAEKNGESPRVIKDANTGVTLLDYSDIL